MRWSPPEWVCSCFPLPENGETRLTMEWLIATLNAHIDTVTEYDTTALGQSLHVAHLLVTMQGEDGRWPTRFDAQTGEELGEERCFTPVPLFRRMNAMLRSTEFDSACRHAEAGGYVENGE